MQRFQGLLEIPAAKSRGNRLKSLVRSLTEYPALQEKNKYDQENSAKKRIGLHGFSHLISFFL